MTVPMTMYEDALSDRQDLENKLYDAINDIETLTDAIKDLLQGCSDEEIESIVEESDSIRGYWNIK